MAQPQIQNDAPIQETQNLDFNSLKPTEKRVLSAMLVAQTDKEAYTIAGLGESQFYVLKRKLLPFKDGLRENLSNKAWDQLLGYVNRAVNVLGSHLEHRDARVAQASAKDILNRILGEPTKRIEERSEKRITILGISASADQLEKLKIPLDDVTSVDLKPENKKDDVQVIEV